LFYSDESNDLKTSDSVALIAHWALPFVHLKYEIPEPVYTSIFGCKGENDFTGMTLIEGDR
jgi:hypothetical protein